MLYVLNSFNKIHIINLGYLKFVKDLGGNILWLKKSKIVISRRLINLI